jgi:WD40 repeat protein
MQLANQPVDDVPFPPPTFQPSAVAKTVNVLWFSSLILSLFAALFGIFVKQWLNTYSNWSDIPNPAEAILVRNLYRGSLKTWHVPEILATLPLLLQLSLIFFVAGLVTYLWSLDNVVAGFVTVLVVSGVMVAMVAVILPVYFPDCSYKSPLGLLLVRILKMPYSTWRDRDLAVVQESLAFGDVNEQRQMYAYNEACALLEVTPLPNGLLSQKDLVATQVSSLVVRTEQSPFRLLQGIISIFAHSQPSVTRPEIVWNLLHLLRAVVGGSTYFMPASVTQGFVAHIAEMRLEALNSPSGAEEQILSMHVLASSIARHRTISQSSGLGEVASQLTDCMQQWLPTSIVGSNKDTEGEKRWQTVFGLLRQRAILTHPHFVYCAAFSPDGTQIVSGSQDQTVRVWDASTGTILHTLQGHTGYISSVEVSLDGTRIVSGSHDHTVRIWDASTGVPIQTLEGHTDYVLSVAFSPDGTYVVSGSGDKTIRVWDTSTGIVLHTLGSHADEVNSVAFSLDGSYIISGSDDRTIRIWTVSAGRVLRTLEGHAGWVNSVQFSPDGTRITSGSSDQTVRVWDAITGALLHTLQGYTNYIGSVVFSPDGTRIASGSHDHTVRVWDVSTGAVIHILEGHAGLVYSAQFSFDGTRIVSSSSDQTVRVWDASIGVVLRTLQGHTDHIGSVAVSLGGAHIVSGSYDQTVRVWDATTGAVLRTLEGHTSAVMSVAFSPDGTHIVSGSDDRTVRIWDAKAGVVHGILEGHTGLVYSVQFSPDGTRIVSSSTDLTVRVWDAGTGAVLHTLEGHTSFVWSAAFSPDGTRIVSGSHDHTVRVWDASTGEVIKTLESVLDSVLSVAFSPDGMSIIADGLFGGSQTWNAPHAFPPPAHPPAHSLLPSSPIFGLQNGWIVVYKDLQATPRRLFWVMPDRRGLVSSRGQLVVLGSEGGILTLLDFTGML